MKLRNLVAAVLVVVTTLSVRSQEGFYYQAVIRNADGSPIKNTQTTLTLTDLDGQKLIHKTYEIPENRELRVTLDGLSTGLYVLRLSSDSLRSEHKLIKQ